jgi:AcrR family transcriptional regulator
MKSEQRRRYRMGARAAAASATGERILAAMEHAFVRQRYEAITLAHIARRAGVTVQTVLRRFGSKDGLLAAGAAAGRARIIAQRAQAPANDAPAAIANLFDHYEAWGALALRLLEQEHLAPIAPITASGRAVHAAWVARVFARHLEGLPARARARRRCQLIALTDVYLWKLLRHDLGLGRRAAERALLEMVVALTRTRRR